MKISIIQPSRNNLKYLKWSYNSIRKNQGNHDVEICVADDFSNDGTWEWCQEMMAKDKMFKAIRNDGPTRLGHTILYDKLINEVASYQCCMIYHADMYLCPGAIDAIDGLLEPGKIVSLTRIEPPLHPPGPEKIIAKFGTEPEQFNEDQFLSWFTLPAFKEQYVYSKDYVKVIDDEHGSFFYTNGVFAPWAFYKQDFQDIGGHDPLFAPQSKEDSDIFNRFLLGGIEFIQTWDGFVYHMTCRGSRFNPTLTTPGVNSDEWNKQNERSARNFIRKWGTFVRHDRLMMPSVAPKYDIGIFIRNASMDLINTLELYCSNLYVIDDDDRMVRMYITAEQDNTKYDLTKRVIHAVRPPESKINDIIVEVDGNTFDRKNDMKYVTLLPDIIQSHYDDKQELGKFQVGNLIITINEVNRIEHQNVKCN